MYFPYFQIFSTIVPLKFEKYMKLLDIFGDIISKCPDIIGKNTPLKAHSLDSSRSIELKLLVNHYETPCMKRGPMKSRCINVWRNKIRREKFYFSFLPTPFFTLKIPGPLYKSKKILPIVGFRVLKTTVSMQKLVLKNMHLVLGYWQNCARIWLFKQNNKIWLLFCQYLWWCKVIFV